MATSAPLNPEPSRPDERKVQRLQPKSYAGAAEEGLENSHSPAIYAGQGIDAASRSPRRNMRKPSGSLQLNGHARGHNSNSTVVERFHDEDGDHLVSVAHDSIFDSSKPPAARRRNSELLSGRKAGARWEESR